MVHRAYLNDPTLTVLDFTNLPMPNPISLSPAGLDARAALVAPKLVKAIATNTYISNLSLSFSNLQSAEGRVLGESIKLNDSLRILNIDSNMLAPADMNIIMQGLAANRS